MWAKIRNEAVSHLNGYSLAAGFSGTLADFPCLGRQTLREASEWKVDYPFCGEHTV